MALSTAARRRPENGPVPEEAAQMPTPSPTLQYASGGLPGQPGQEAHE